MNGMNVDENDDMDDDVVDDDDSVENGKVVDQKGSDLTDENEDCDASIDGIVHEDDDIMREEDDAFLLSDKELVDLAEIGEMDITINPLEKTEQTRCPFTLEERSRNNSR